eukprot:CAMPEP_0113448386 /NCGR_PEP_ID=MMETSP0014_2-20120614/4739_1 /TAXON_ID=2857 /ORGANISM="Nitzschia sp." /LENGTH=512 /DNA_ID=CAMNT_0000339595 /DNA_START=532 /DNA_END=2070 /DNA_ORIENTATION=- /assembly_acc=CAM_ASM_000159
MSSSSSSSSSTTSTSKPSTLTNSRAEDTNETSSVAATVATTETTATTNHATTDRSKVNSSSNSSNSKNRIQNSSRTATNTNNNKSNNNKYGSVEDLQMYALGIQNTRLATDLSQARHDWDTLQHSYRANTHARFVYQTTLARIVAHVQDFSDDKVLIEDILRWDGECEHLEEEHGDDDDDDDDDEGLQGQERIQGLHGSIRSLGSNGSGGDLHAYNSTTPNSPVQAVKQSRYHNGPIIIDWNDVETTVSSEFESPSSLLGLPYSYCRSHHESLNEQNNCMKCEIEKWKASMARIRACNQNEVNELLKHQRTLSKVVDRIKASSFRSKEKVVKWYEECQEEAKRCGSFSEKDAEDLIAGDLRTEGDLDHEAIQQKKADCNEKLKIGTDDSGQTQDEEKQGNVVEDVRVQKTSEKVLNSRIGPDGFETFDGMEHEEDTTVRTMSSSMDDTACPLGPPNEGLMSTSTSSSFPPSQLKENKTMQTASSQTFVPKPSSPSPPPVPTRVQTTCGCIIM